MGKAKKLGEFEPTLSDVLEAVQTGFGEMEERFNGVGERFNKVENKIGDVENRMTAVEKRLGAVGNTLEDMRETLKGVERAVDKDAVTIISHGRRIAHLEKTCA